MPPTPILTPRPSYRRGRAVGWWLIGLGLIVFPTLLYLGNWYVRKARLDWVIQRGQASLANARDPATVEAALRQWEAETSKYWQLDRERLIERLISFSPEADGAARRMLTYVAGVDYGARKEDWERWAADRKRLAKGQGPKLEAKEVVRLEERWRANIGLTSWYSTILPIDEQVYIASLGAGWEMADDAADGIARVDGRTGESALFFQVPQNEKAPRDVVGICAGEDCLFAAIRNGTVFCVERDGQVRWRGAAGGVIVSTPLAVDANRDNYSDVCVCTSGGRLVCLSGTTGKPIWNTPLGTGAELAPTHFPATVRADVYVTLALGDVGGGGAKEIVATTGSGRVFVLATSDGKVQWKHAGSNGFAAGGVHAGEKNSEKGVFFACDFQGQLWSVGRSGRELAATMRAYTPLPAQGGVAAALRTIPSGGQMIGGWLIAAGGDDEHDGRLTLLGTPERDWIYTTAGELGVTPAIADVNGDGAADVICCVRPRLNSGGSAALEIVSGGGHLLRRAGLPANVTAAPVVADVDGDGRLDILLADESGVLRCLATRQAGPIAWGLYGGDSHNTRSVRNAFEYSQTPSGYQWKWKPK